MKCQDFPRWMHRMIAPVAGLIMLSTLTTAVIYVTAKYLFDTKLPYAMLLHQGAFWGTKDQSRVVSAIAQAIILGMMVWSGFMMFKLDKSLLKKPTTMRQFHHRLTLVTGWWYFVIALTGASYRLLSTTFKVPKQYIRPLMMIHSCNFHPNATILYAYFIAFVTLLVVVSGTIVYVPIMKVRARRFYRRVVRKLLIKANIIKETKLHISIPKHIQKAEPVTINVSPDIMEPLYDKEAIQNYDSITETIFKHEEEGDAIIIDVEELGNAMDECKQEKCHTCMSQCTKITQCVHMR